MRLVVAIGGNALLRRGQVLSAENQLDNIRTAAVQLARVAAAHELVLTHGNGPQVGLLSLQSAAYKDAESYPLDVLGAETDGMLGYLIEQELSNALGGSRTVATLLTRVEVDATDPAFAHPTKPIGPVYTQSEAQRIAAARHRGRLPRDRDRCEGGLSRSGNAAAARWARSRRRRLRNTRSLPGRWGRKSKPPASSFSRPERPP